MNLSKLKATMGVAVMTLVSYSPVWAQIQDGCFPDCPDGGTGGGGGGDPQLAGPAVLVLIAIGIVSAIVMTKRK